MGHLKLHNIDDGDNVFMHKMSSNNWQRAQQEGGKINWARWQYSPSTSDRYLDLSYPLPWRLACKLVGWFNQQQTAVHLEVWNHHQSIEKWMLK